MVSISTHSLYLPHLQRHFFFFPFFLSLCCLFLSLFHILVFARGSSGCLRSAVSLLFPLVSLQGKREWGVVRDELFFSSRCNIKSGCDASGSLMLSEARIV